MSNYHPRTDVSFAATKPFIKAFPSEAFAMHKKFNTPTWSLRIIEEDQEVLRQISEQMSSTPPAPPAFVVTTTTAEPTPTADPVLLPEPRFPICAPTATAVPSTEASVEINADMVALGIGAVIFLVAGYFLYRAFCNTATEVVAATTLP